MIAFVMSVEELHREIEFFIAKSCPKNSPQIRSLDEISQLEIIITNWKKMAKHGVLEKLLIDELDPLMEICVHEKSKSLPMRNPVCVALRKFNRIAYEKAVVMAKADQLGMIPQEMRAASKKIEDSLEDSIEEDYFREANGCIQSGYLRSFIIMTWNIVMYRLYKRISAAGLANFAAAYTVTFPGRKNGPSTMSDLCELSDFEVIRTSSNRSMTPRLIDKDQEKILQKSLTTRNLCAHVSERYKPKEAAVICFADEVADSFLSF
jgi:hypothetical protein